MLDASTDNSRHRQEELEARIRRSLSDCRYKCNDFTICIPVYSEDPTDLPSLFMPVFSEDSSRKTGRALVCKCCAGENWSITVRDFEGEIPYTTKLLESSACEIHPYEPSSDVELAIRKKRYFNTVGFLCKTLAGEILSESEHVPYQGLLAIAGSTRSGKSVIAQGLIYKYLVSRTKAISTANSKHPGKERRPHLITLEKPIEKFFYRDQNGKPIDIGAIRDLAVDYTPREIQKDTPSIEAGLDDALRQTPSIVYVGEIRGDHDWQTILEFAGTGHLVVTTTHAGSLVELMSGIFKALDARTPARRAHIAERILGLVHLRSDTFKIGTSESAATIPALWRHTPEGISSLVSAGLAAMLPHYSAIGTAESFRRSSLGRRWFVERLIDECVRSDELVGELRGSAIEWDLEGI